MGLLGAVSWMTMSLTINAFTVVMECLNMVACSVITVHGACKLIAGSATRSISGRELISTPDVSQKKRPVVAIVGGSFGGLACARELSKDCDVILIDKKRYFEYTPGVLRLFTKPSLAPTLRAPLDTFQGVRFMEGKLVGVREWSLRIKSRDDEEEEDVLCDVSVIACGSGYGAGIKADDNEVEADSRQETWEASAVQLQAAKSVLVLGGGAVGVELAAEIAEAYPQKQVTIVDSHTALCSTFAHPKSVSHIMRWFEARKNVEMVLGHRIAQSTPWVGGSIRTYTLENGRRLVADVTYDCRGAQPSTSPFASTLPASSMTERGQVLINDRFQVMGHERVFALGDMASLPGGARPALGHTAEYQASTVCQNVRRVCTGRPLCRFPEGDAKEATMYVVSLGFCDASLRFGPIVVSGFLAAFLKWGIEWSKVAQQRQRPIGMLLWKFADIVTTSTVDASSLPIRPEGEERGKGKAGGAASGDARRKLF